MAKRKMTRTWSVVAASAASLLLGSCGDSQLSLPAPTGRPLLPPAPNIDPPKPSPQQPPPISGGTLLVTHDDATLVAADPDRDTIWLVDAATQKLRQRVQLDGGSEPGRVIEDRQGKVHVALRRAGQVVAIDPQSGAILSQRAVCATPRGLAYDAAVDNLYVACASGELVTLPAAGGAISRRITVDSDLRDIVLKGDHLLVSRFRSAELLELDSSGTLLGRVAPRSATGDLGMVDPMGKPSSSSPNTAWRLVVTPGGGVAMLHQRAIDGTISTKMGGYGSGPCKGGGIVSTGLTLFSGASGSSSVGSGAMVSMVAMAVDVAASPDGQKLAIVSLSGLSNMASPGTSTSQVTVINKSDLTPSDGCRFPTAPSPSLPSGDSQLTAISYDSKGQLWAQQRNAAQLLLLLTGTAPQAIALPGAEDRASDGHRLFHSPTRGMIACASCHAEGGDDGHVWTFDTVGPRRTQSLRGGILATAPFHWDGELQDVKALMHEVFAGRMAGGELTSAQSDAVGKWLDAQPPLPKPAAADPAAVERGKALFQDATVACASCHSGSHLTSNRNETVGTGKSFQVPGLTDLALRAPYMHNGCAPTLRARFDPACGGGDSHGKTSQLTANQLSDLVQYLETL